MQLLNAVASDLHPPIRIEFASCPLCSGPGSEIKTVMCGARGNSPRDLTWMRCRDCEHVYAKHYFVGEGRTELLTEVAPDQRFGGPLDVQRWTWNGILNRITAHAKPRTKRLIDVGIGNGACLFTAAEMGFDAVGIDIREDLLRTPRALGYNVELVDAMDFDYSGAGIVVLADVLEHVPYPRKLLTRIRAGLEGALFVSCPNMDCVSWRYMDRQGANVFWVDQEHYHNFTRQSLQTLLRVCGFTPVDYSVSSRYQMCMEVIAT